MAIATVNGLRIGYEIVGDGDRPWVLTPGGRYGRDAPGLRELAEGIAANNARVLLWDRPNTGESDVCFEGETESTLNADTLAGLLKQLAMAPAVIAGGSAGARVSMLAITRHPEVAQAVAMWWVSGGPYELFVLGNVYCTQNIAVAWRDGMEAVAELPEWAGVIERNPSNRERIRSQDPKEFIATMERWLLAFTYREDETIPGLPDADVRKVTIPALVINSDESDANHPRYTTEAMAKLLPNSTLVEPPWGPREWWERSAQRMATNPKSNNEPGPLFSGWPQLAPQLNQWADTVLS